MGQTADLEVIRAGAATVPDPLPALPQRLRTLGDLTAGYLIRFRPATRQAYQGDLASWLTFCDQTRIDPLTAGIHHADTYLRVLDELGDPRTHPRQHQPAGLSRGRVLPLRRPPASRRRITVLRHRPAQG